MNEAHPLASASLRPWSFAWLLAGITSTYARGDMVDLPLEQLMQMR